MNELMNDLCGCSKELPLYFLGEKKCLHTTLGSGIYFFLCLSQTPLSLYLCPFFFLLFSPDSIPLKDSFLCVPLSMCLIVFAFPGLIPGIPFFSFWEQILFILKSVIFLLELFSIPFPPTKSVFHRFNFTGSTNTTTTMLWVLTLCEAMR